MEHAPFGQSDLDTCRSLQREEYEVLESIYPDFIASSLRDGSMRLEIPVELGDAKSVAAIGDEQIVGSCVDSEQTTTVPQGFPISLETLPALLLHVFLPQEYPLLHPPRILSLYATHAWLTRVHVLQQRLLGMWKAGNTVIYDWIEYLRSAEFLDVISLKSPIDDLILIPHPAPHLLLPLLLRYDNCARSDRFSHNTFSCSICFSGYKGARCLQLLCSHVFCRTCLEDFWKLCIAEGDVGRVGCPDPECVKAGKEAEEEEVARVVTEDELKRWRWLREKRTFEKDPTVIHCPVISCQTPVAKSTKEEHSGYERLRTCTSCGYSFCSLCKRTWHGPHSSCPISSVEKLVAQYMSADSPLRKVMERQYGSAVIAKLVAKYEEEQKNERWIADSTMACPGCQVNVEKSRGCNHMTCSKCQQHFCYRCGVNLPASNPYEHFSTRGLRCYSKLFDFEDRQHE